MNYREAVEYIESIPKFTKKNKISHTQKAMEDLGCKSPSFKVIHVAGTNGKGSVCAYLASVLQESGKKVGLFTSPHLVDIRERFIIDGSMISKEFFLEAFLKVFALSQRMQKENEGHPSYFEFLFLMSLCIFEKKGVEYVILETGLGGRLDATNSIESPLLTIITSISLDHTEILGETIAEIAGEKAGIIKSSIPLVYLKGQKDVVKVIKIRASQKKAPVYPVSKEHYEILQRKEDGILFLYKEGEDRIRIELPFVADYQVENASITIKSLLTLSQIDGDLKKSLSYGTIQRGIEKTKWQGRMEVVGKGIILDGAHNEDGIENFLNTVNSFSKDKKPSLLFSAVMEKNYKKMIEKICQSVEWEQVTVTQVGGYRALKAAELAHIFRENGVKKVKCRENVGEALELARKEKGDGILFCAGSLYLIGDIKSYLELEEKKYD